MLRVSLVCALFSLCLAEAPTPNYEMEWQLFKKTYEKHFEGTEESSRFEIFKKNLDTINEYNAKDLSYKLGVNEFAHLDPDEFASIYYGWKKPDNLWGELPNLGTHVYSGAPLADSVDWTTKGAVTPVKNQGHCGSCWSFSATGAMEGAWEIATGKSVSLSEQQFLDCDKVDHACSGGIMESAFKYAEQNALCTEDSYAYHAKKGNTCNAANCTVAIPKGGITGYKDVPGKNMEALMDALSKQPVSIAIEADKSVFQLYKSGVLSGSACGTKLDHGVLAVGYGSLDGKDYWKVKNSWGPTWGDHGYVMLERGVAGPGECGLLSQPTYPVVSGAEKIVV